MDMKCGRIGIVAVTILGCLCFVAGCSHDTGQTDVKFDASKKYKPSDSQVQAIENNPNIPPQQKAMIKARMGQGPVGEAAAKAGKTGGP